MTPRSMRRRGRAGMSLIELMIALTLFAIVGGAVVQVMIKQQRISQRAAATIDTRDQSRITLATLAAELKALSSVGGDVDPIDFTATSIRIRTLIGTSVVCRTAAGGAVLTLPPSARVRPVNANGVVQPEVVLSSFVDPSAPAAIGDTVWVFDPTAAAASPWVAKGIVAPGVVMESGGLGCPTNGPGNYMSTSNAALQSFIVTLEGTVPNAVVGSPVRITRTVRYSFAQNPAGTGPWYLNYQDCTGGGGCGAAQPVSGPFRPGTGSPATTGFRFAYYDSTGAVTATAANISRIDIVARTESRERVSSGSSDRQSIIQTDSLSVALRNRQ